MFDLCTDYGSSTSSKKKKYLNVKSSRCQVKIFFFPTFLLVRPNCESIFSFTAVDFDVIFVGKKKLINRQLKNSLDIFAVRDEEEK